MKCRVFEIDYDPVLRTEMDNLDCFIVSKTTLSDSDIENAIAHPKGEIVINAVFELTREQLESSENQKRIIYIDKFEDAD